MPLHVKDTMDVDSMHSILVLHVFKASGEENTCRALHIPSTCLLLHYNVLQPAAHVCNKAAGSNAMSQQTSFLGMMRSMSEGHLRAELQIVISQDLHERSLAEVEKTHSVGRPAVTLDHRFEVTSQVITR